MSRHEYTPEEKQFLRDNVTGNSYLKLTEMFNKRFGSSLGYRQIKCECYYLGLRNGLPQFRLKPGNTVHMKGLGSKYKPDDPKYTPIGTERLDKSGYVKVKIAGSYTWKSKNQVIWEAANGPIPKNHVVIFADRDKSNFDLNNLILVSKAELTTMARNKLLSSDPELTRAGKVIADIKLRIAELSGTSKAKKEGKV